MSERTDKVKELMDFLFKSINTLDPPPVMGHLGHALISTLNVICANQGVSPESMRQLLDMSFEEYLLNLEKFSKKDG